MKDWNIQAEKEVHHKFYNKIWSVGYKGWNKWYACNLFIKEEYQEWHNQDYIGILVYKGIRVTQEVEGSNHTSWIWIYKR